ncbi:MAG TPA: HNH endonuclease [Anaerolineales bacterium]|nr:HNH endonuclease [Anaerolineales bacterium]
MPVNFEWLRFGEIYERPFLAKNWGYQSFHAISKGVITPAGTNYIIFFVTKDKQEALTQYNDYIDGSMLFWEGEEKHSSDKRVIDARNNGDEIHLFYREIHHTPFVYFGKISLTDYQLKDDSPSEFVFKIEALSYDDVDVFKEVREHAAEYKTLAVTEQEQVVKSRIGQGNFRRHVIQLWGSCSITGLQNISLLKASHIKPWKDSSNEERLTPYNGLLLIPDYDFLFDRGYISFKNSGSVLVSQRMSPFARKVFDVRNDLQLRKVFPQNQEYLEFHRSEVFV